PMSSNDNSPIKDGIFPQEHRGKPCGQFGSQQLTRMVHCSSTEIFNFNIKLRLLIAVRILPEPPPFGCICSDLLCKSSERCSRRSRTSISRTGYCGHEQSEHCEKKNKLR